MSSVVLLPKRHLPPRYKEITPKELKVLIDIKKDFQLIDVREPYEYEISNIDGELIPLSIVADDLDKIAKDKPVIPSL